MNVLISCGGTGGHIFPAMALADSLGKSSPDARFLFVLSGRAIEKDIFGKRGDRTVHLDLSTISRSFSRKSMTALMKLVIAFFRSISVILAFKPDVSVGFGGYASVPPVLASAVMRVPVIIHEQNARFGLANRFLSVFARGVAVSFSRMLDGRNNRKYRLTGNPLRSGLVPDGKAAALGFFALSDDRNTFLVMGGSQGSHSINDAACGAFSALERSLLEKVQIIHLCGTEDEEMRVKSTYADLGVPAWVRPFLEDMSYAYNAADIVISRAGAMTIAEIVHFAVPSVLIPYPYGDKHQLDNARILAEAGAAVILDDDGRLDGLKDIVKDFIAGSSSLINAAGSLKGLMPTDAAEKLSDMISSLARARR
ncbi:MAG: undecaprenyldiphospho-muramoylpentapeptide beta-N-acetylglucosaminyltransferase [Candidatus Omnitrophica bacterium CG1_02_49_10]|nr:MAG: undecaprenyldiphospho-muramoylpentapeptide beta-N-acetylglucosaminyltransferase [Candidatus Omnitrophica bacterium CG1_02_49_10]